MRRLAQFFRLSSTEQLLLLQCWMLLPLIAVALRLFGLKRVIAWLALQPQDLLPHQSDDTPLATARQIARLVRIAGTALPFKSSCLPMSLLLKRLLATRGIAADLRLGVRKVADRLDAHAWVEVDGHVLIDSSERQADYAAFDAVDARPAVIRD